MNETSQPDLIENLEGCIQEEQFSWKIAEGIGVHKILCDFGIRFDVLTASLSRISYHIHLET